MPLCTELPVISCFQHHTCIKKKKPEPKKAPQKLQTAQPPSEKEETSGRNNTNFMHLTHFNKCVTVWENRDILVRSELLPVFNEVKCEPRSRCRGLSEFVGFYVVFKLWSAQHKQSQPCCTPTFPAQGHGMGWNVLESRTCNDRLRHQINSTALSWGIFYRCFCV